MIVSYSSVYIILYTEGQLISSCVLLLENILRLYVIMKYDWILSDETESDRASIKYMKGVKERERC